MSLSLMCLFTFEKCFLPLPAARCPHLRLLKFLGFSQVIPTLGGKN